MDIKTALEIIGQVQDNLGLGLLETLKEMQENIDEFNDKEVRAFRVAMRDFSKLFAAKV